MKFITTIIAGVIVGALGVYFTLDWQEEKMNFSITSPAKFGDINYQNIALSNDGWNPAVNIKLYIDHPDIKFENMQSTASVNNLSSEHHGIAGVERLRRGETVIFSLAYKGQPLFGSEIKVLSDRSIAQQKELDANTHLPGWALIVMWTFGFFFVFSMLSSITIPAYKSYVRRANESKAKEGQKNKF